MVAVCFDIIRKNCNEKFTSGMPARTLSEFLGGETEAVEYQQSGTLKRGNGSYMRIGINEVPDLDDLTVLVYERLQ